VTTSLRKIEANRRNAGKSTGPRTPAGKAASAQNARTHGALSTQAISACEDHEAFESLCAAFHAQYNPQSPLECTLVDKLTLAVWRDRRLAIAESVAMDAETLDLNERYSPSEATRLRMGNGVLAISTSLLFGRYQVMITNEIEKTMRMLRDVQERHLNTIEAATFMPAANDARPIGEDS